MDFKRLLKKIGKNLLAFIIGASVGMVVSILYLFAVWIPTEGYKVGLAIIGIFPAMLVLFSMIGLVVGGVLGLVGYWLVKFIRVVW